MRTRWKTPKRRALTTNPSTTKMTFSIPSPTLPLSLGLSGEGQIGEAEAAIEAEGAGVATITSGGVELTKTGLEAEADMIPEGDIKPEKDLKPEEATKSTLIPSEIQTIQISIRETRRKLRESQMASLTQEAEEGEEVNIGEEANTVEEVSTEEEENTEAEEIEEDIEGEEEAMHKTRKRMRRPLAHLHLKISNSIMKLKAIKNNREVATASRIDHKTKFLPRKATKATHTN